METLRERVVSAIEGVFEKYFGCPERSWPSQTHDAIHKVKEAAMGAIRVEFDRGNEAPAGGAATKGQEEE
jgi:hypothetical protein